jgi:hypothetical protein
MKFFVNGIIASCIVALSSTSSAEPPPVDESQKWVPSLAVTSGFLVQSPRGEVASTTARPADSGSEALISPWLGGSLELMSPAWDPLGGRTRFFVHAGLAANFGSKRDLAKEGSPQELIVPTIPASNEDLVRGQGSTTDAQPTGFLVSAGAGLSITIDTEWRRLRIKPSIEYLLQEIEVGGRVHAATSDDPTIPSFNLFVIRGNEKQYFHGLGPGLEVEADVARTGPLMLALLASGSAYRVIGDRDVEFSSTDATGAESATFRYRQDAWSYRAHVGLRFRWVPDP